MKFIYQSQQRLLNHNIHPESILSCWWDHDFTTQPIQRSYCPNLNNQIRNLLYSEQYQQLLHYQNVLVMWSPSTITMPKSMQQFNELLLYILEGAEEKHFYKLFALKNLPNIIKTFIYIYLALACPALL
jgi:2-oxoglutarate dehydrogenase complex dehydrogenase (E1) component-like enzyme